MCPSTFTIKTSLLKIGRLVHKSGFVDSQLLPTVSRAWPALARLR